MQQRAVRLCLPSVTLCLAATVLLVMPNALDAAQSVHVVKLQHMNSSAEERLVRMEDKCKPAKKCIPGLILPVWEPQVNMKFPTMVFRAFVYLMALFYLFLGVSIVSDRFMAAIEVITSQEREVKVKRCDANGKVVTTTVLVRIWNETVSNLTLMALGSSAPEILLSIIEICGNGFEAGDLGPGTIVGSAAFNLFIIIAICIATIPNGEKRRIERNDVFWVTLIWSTFAYIWLYLILCVISPSVVEVWEGVLTFVFFFLTVISSYLANVYTPALKRKILKTSTLTAHGHTIRTRPEVEVAGITLTDGKNRAGEALLDNNHNVTGAAATSSSINGAASNGTSRTLFRRSTMDEAEAQAFEDHRQKFVNAFQRLRAEHPDMPLRQIGRLVTQKTLADAPKSRAFRRMQATRQLTAYGQSRLASIDFSSSIQENRPDEQDAIELRSGKIVVSFQPSHYICAEDVGTVKLFVKCERGAAITVPTIVYVNYETVNGTAKAGEDYVHTHGMLAFQPDVRQQEIQVRIVDNDVYEFDEEFFVRLSAPKAVNARNSEEKYPAVLGSANEALVIIVDDDHAGHFGFESQVYRVMENQGIFYLKVNRQRGARGKVIVPYKIVEGRAKRNVDFKCEDGELIFADHQTTAEIRIEIINDDLYEKAEDFYVELGEPRWEDPGSSQPHKRRLVEDGAEKPDGRPFLGDNNRCKVVIKEDDELRSFVDRLVACANSSLMVGTSTWREQFQEALSPPLAADDDADEAEAIDAAITEESRRRGEAVYAAVVEERRRQPTPCQWMMHYLSLPWKLMFAFIPPTDYLHGWLCFIFAITLIGVLTALIGDVAAMFGCTIGLKDTVTAITLVALGTSLPDTFASKLAAVQDKTADSSIGNVTGSNAVNVFLGIGIAWAMAAIYHSYKGDVFHVHSGSLEASVALFLIGSIICTIVLEYRRFSPKIGAELGGPPVSKWISVSIFVLVWILYIIYCVLDAYCII